MDDPYVTRLYAWGRLLLAAMYQLGVFLIVALIAVYWDRISKLDVGLLAMVVGGLLAESKDACAYFFTHRGDPTQPKEMKP